MDNRDLSLISMATSGVSQGRGRSRSRHRTASLPQPGVAITGPPPSSWIQAHLTGPPPFVLDEKQQLISSWQKEESAEQQPTSPCKKQGNCDLQAGSSILFTSTRIENVKSQRKKNVKKSDKKVKWSSWKGDEVFFDQDLLTLIQPGAMCKDRTGAESGRHQDTQELQESFVQPAHLDSFPTGDNQRSLHTESWYDNCAVPCCTAQIPGHEGPQTNWNRKMKTCATAKQDKARHQHVHQEKTNQHVQKTTKPKKKMRNVNVPNFSPSKSSCSLTESHFAMNAWNLSVPDHQKTDKLVSSSENKGKKSVTEQDHQKSNKLISSFKNKGQESVTEQDKKSDKLVSSSKNKGQKSVAEQDQKKSDKLLSSRNKGEKSVAEQDQQKSDELVSSSRNKGQKTVTEQDHKKSDKLVSSSKNKGQKSVAEQDQQKFDKLVSSSGNKGEKSVTEQDHQKSDKLVSSSENKGEKSVTEQDHKKSDKLASSSMNKAKKSVTEQDHQKSKLVSSSKNKGQKSVTKQDHQKSDKLVLSSKNKVDKSIQTQLVKSAGKPGARLKHLKEEDCSQPMNISNNLIEKNLARMPMTNYSPDAGDPVSGSMGTSRATTSALCPSPDCTTQSLSNSVFTDNTRVSDNGEGSDVFHNLQAFTPQYFPAADLVKPRQQVKLQGLKNLGRMTSCYEVPEVKTEKSKAVDENLTGKRLSKKAKKKLKMGKNPAIPSKKPPDNVKVTNLGQIVQTISRSQQEKQVISNHVPPSQTILSEVSSPTAGVARKAEQLNSTHHEKIPNTAGRQIIPYTSRQKNLLSTAVPNTKLHKSYKKRLPAGPKTIPHDFYQQLVRKSVPVSSTFDHHQVTPYGRAREMSACTYVQVTGMKVHVSTTPSSRYDPQVCLGEINVLDMMCVNPPSFTRVSILPSDDRENHVQEGKKKKKKNKKKSEEK